jgi:uncharacterized protein YndB with AHSA1/START domain
MTTTLPEHPTNASLIPNYPHWTLRLQRTFPQGRDAVWAAITEPDKVAQWTPFRPNHNLGTAGPVRLKQIDGGDETIDSEVREVRHPESLTYLWGTDQLRFGLADAGAATDPAATVDMGTILTLAQTFDNRTMAGSLAAGWHICLGALELLLNGDEVPSVVGEKAKEFGWEELEQRYGALFEEQREASLPADRTEDEAEE